MCKAPEYTIERYYNNDKSPVKSSNPSAGISNSIVKYENGVLKCSFTRDKSLANVDQFYNLTRPTYILVAQGQLSGGNCICKIPKTRSLKLVYNY